MKPVSKLSRSVPAVALFICGLVSLFVIVLRVTGRLESLELAAYDWTITLLPKASGINPRIVFIGIGEDDIRNEGLWPLPDATLAQALKILTEFKPRAIGVDIYRDMPVAPGREELESILTGNPRIIAPMKFGPGGIPAPSVLKGSTQVAFNDVVVDPDGTVRRALIFLDDGQTVFYSFALRLALIYLKDEGISPRPDTDHPEYIRIGESSIKPFESDDGGYAGADARGYQFLIDFKDSPGSFQCFSLASLLFREIDPQSVTGKIVIIGVTAQGVKDFFNTPSSRSFKGDEQVFGITLHAHITSQLLRLGLKESQPINTAGKMEQTSWTILWSLLGGAIGLWVRSPWRFSTLAGGSLFTLCLIVCAAFMRSWWIPLVPPAIAFVSSTSLVTAYVSNHERRQRALLMQIFSRHVSKEIAQSVWQQRDKFLDGGRPRAQKLVITTLFSDLKGFTPIAEMLDPLELIDWLNVYMETMAGLVSEHGGVIDDYAGDGIKADFGIPTARANEDEIRRDAINAVNCALAMGKEMRRINEHWRRQNLPTVGLRIGILTGQVVAGAIGSAERLKYTTIGITVNAASRLESYDKESFLADSPAGPCRILIGENTFRYVSNDFEIQKVGKANLRGLDQEIIVYRVLDRKHKDSGNVEEEQA